MLGCMAEAIFSNVDLFSRFEGEIYFDAICFLDSEKIVYGAKEAV